MAFANQSAAADDYAHEIIQTQERLAAERSVFESHWQEIAEFTDPARAEFTGEKTPGSKRNERIFDATAPLALQRFAAAVDGYATPRTQKWHNIIAADPAVDAKRRVRIWLDGLRDLLFRMRYAPAANFAQQASEAYISLGAYGTSPFFSDAVPGLALGLPNMRYRALHLAECYIDADYTGRVDRMHRKFKLTARQAIQQFGDKVGDRVKVAKDTDQFTFLHCVKPNAERDPRRRDYRGMKFSSCYVCIEDKKIVGEGGYYTFPFAVGRWMTAPREVYGRSPCMQVLPDIKMLNEIAKTIIRAAHKQVDPPLLVFDDGALQQFATRPGALNFGGVDYQGRARVVPLQNGANVELGVELADRLRNNIFDALLVSLFQILVKTPEMTATEAAIRAQEKGQLLAPNMGRAQSELWAPTIEREIDILIRSGAAERALGPMPPELEEIGGEYAIVFDSPLTKAMNAEEGVAILRTLDAAANLSTLDPAQGAELIRAFNLPEIGRELARIHGMKEKLLRSEAEVQAMIENEKQAQAATQAVEAAPQIASAAKDLALAGQVAGQSSRTPIPGAQVKAA